MSNGMKFTKTNTGTYTSGRFTIQRTYRWELQYDGFEVMSFTSLAAAKAYAAEMTIPMDEAEVVNA